MQPTEDAADLSTLPNGTRLNIIEDAGRWFRVSAGHLTGYLHHTWVRVDQFDSGSFEQRHIQIKSFKTYEESAAFLRTFTLPLSIYLASNGWFAITLDEYYDKDAASRALGALKQRQLIPQDSMMTSGNTYVRKVCCDVSSVNR